MLVLKLNHVTKWGQREPSFVINPAVLVDKTMDISLGITNIKNRLEGFLN